VSRSRAWGAAAGLLVTGLATLVLAAGGASAGAQVDAAGPVQDGYIPWPSALPGRTVGPSGPPRGMPGCRGLELVCVNRLMRRLRTEWRAHDAACDHRVIFSLGYLRITGEIRKRLRAEETFRYRRWFIGVVQGFSNLYFKTARRYDAGKAVPESWRIYYDAMDSGDYNAGQDLLLASNAHTNHDLPYAYAAAGLLNRRGASRKRDHDAVNEVNAAVFDELAAYYEEHYDPFFARTNMASPLDQLTSLQIVQLWRENAWRQAERLVDAGSRAELQRVQRDIETTSATWARLITAGAEPGHREVRDAYCASR
jgi:hypothetical protein